MNFYIARDRIGPLDDGPRKGTYIEAGEIVSVDTFKPESIPVLEALGFIEATDEPPTPVPQPDEGDATGTANQVIPFAQSETKDEFFALPAENADGKTEEITSRKRGRVQLHPQKSTEVDNE